MDEQRAAIAVSKKVSTPFPRSLWETEGRKTLELLLQFNQLEEIVTTDSYEFAKDSLYCEWAYIIDFDKNAFEVYKGLNTMGIRPEDRFFSLMRKVMTTTRLKSYSLFQ